VTRRRERRWRKLVNRAYRAYRCNWPRSGVSEKAYALAYVLKDPVGEDECRRTEMARYWALLYSGSSTRRFHLPAWGAR
jgi:hypothetical protein